MQRQLVERLGPESAIKASRSFLFWRRHFAAAGDFYLLQDLARPREIFFHMIPASFAASGLVALKYSTTERHSTQRPFPRRTWWMRPLSPQ